MPSTTSPNGKPADPDPVEGPPALRLDFNDLDAGDLEDIAEYSGRDDVLGLIMSAYQAAAKAEPGDRVQVMMTALPAKVFTALLGVARRHQDPDWTPEHWRKFRFADLLGSGDDEMDPTSAGSIPGSTSAAPPSGQPEPARSAGSAAISSGPTRS